MGRNESGPQDVQKGLRARRSERRGEAYSVLYVEPLSHTRTKLEDFFNILLESISKLLEEDRDAHESTPPRHGVSNALFPTNEESSFPLKPANEAYHKS
jgi:hypothetical protein